MDILLLCYEYPPLGGGGGVGAQQYAEAWAAKGHRVTVLTGGATGLAAVETVRGVEIVRTLPFGRRGRATATVPSMLSYILLGALYVLRHRRELAARCQVINSHFAIPTGPLAALVARLLRRPNVLTIIGGDIYDPSKRSSPHRSAVLRRVNRWLLEDADRVVAISSDTKRRAEQWYRVRRPIEIINYGFTPGPPASTPPAGTVAQRDPRRFRLVAVGRLVPRKGFSYLITALALLPEEVELILIGDGPAAHQLQQLAATKGVAGRVTFPGFLTRDQIYHQLRQADCFVLPSLHEGLGIVVQEAMAAGLPVVATNNGGQVDLIQAPRNGLLVEPGDAAALAAAIRTLYEDRALASAMGVHNRADITRWDLDRNCELYLDVFRALVAATPPRRACNLA